MTLTAAKKVEMPVGGGPTSPVRCFGSVREQSIAEMIHYKSKDRQFARMTLQSPAPV